MDHLLWIFYLDLDPTNTWFIYGFMVPFFYYYTFIFTVKMFTVRP
jgi:hypothetical protein